MEDQYRLRIFGAANDLRGGRQAICRDRVGPQHRGKKQTRQHPGTQGAAQRDRALCLWLVRPSVFWRLFGIGWGATTYYLLALPRTDEAAAAPAAASRNAAGGR